MKRALVIFGGMLAVVAMPIIATAHNAGRIILPDGTCRELGSFKEAPFVGPDKTQLDLVPATPPPRDEYGVSFVGFNQKTPILPGGCPAVSATTADPAGTPAFAEVSYQ